MFDVRYVKSASYIVASLVSQKHNVKRFLIFAFWGFSLLWHCGVYNSTAIIFICASLSGPPGLFSFSPSVDEQRHSFSPLHQRRPSAMSSTS